MTARTPAALAALLTLAVAFFAAPQAARAHEATVTGEVLAATKGSDRAIVRVDFGGGDSRTESVRLVPASRAAGLSGGDRFTATLDADRTPWTLSALVVTGKSSFVGAAAIPALAPAIRYVTPVRIGEPIPAPAGLLDQRGAPFSFAAFRGEAIVLAFVYTRCRDQRECPLVTGKFAVLQQLFRAKPVHLVEVTLDPQYDRPAVLARYASRFGADAARWSFVTGDPRTLRDFAAQFQVTAFPDPRLGLIHSERTVLVDRNGIVADMVADIGWLPSDIVAETEHERGADSDPIGRFNLWLSSAAVAMCGNAVQSFSGFEDLAIVLVVVALGVFAAWRVIRVLQKA